MNLESEVLQVNLDDIIPNRFQPRISFDEQGLKELADSIKEHGIIQPLVLRKLGDKYEIIAGERRYKAATMAGLVTVPAVISNLDDNKSAEVALVENIQRRDLTPIEEAKSYKQLLDKGYLTQEQLAKRMGVSQPAIANKLRLLNLDEEVQQALLAEKISERHARALLQIGDKEEQKKWLNRVINERLTVRQLDQEIKKMIESGESTGDIPTVELTPSVEEITANAQDLIQPETKNIQDLMKPSPLMTDFESPINNNPVVMDVKKEEDEEPEKEPDPMPSTNRFFNFSDTDPLNMDVNEIEPASVFNKSDDIEVIDMPILNTEKEPEELEEEKVEEEPEVLNTDFDRNPNNRFFTPVTDTREDVPEILKQPEELIIDPMSQVDTLETPSTEEILSIKETDLMNGVKEVRDTIEELKNRGYNIHVEEMDLDDKYKITIDIDK